ncbi:aspartic proteinase CDR1-like [Malania oleifera]|uniref:aspartic proteinase CDR1-like n=1 Tax=Malania oleifera TaxID=397392 RepID=UPI0025AE35B8|nr:aspartic proteinase CDR1-like [Malania oleifera]
MLNMSNFFIAVVILTINLLFPISNVVAAIDIGIFRAELIRQDKLGGSTQSPEAADQVHYLVKFSLGASSFDVYAVADTGSDLIWTHCFPCPSCHIQPTPLFHPLNSSTYRSLNCRSKRCRRLTAGEAKCSSHAHCVHDYVYPDGSVAPGFLAEEMFTFYSTAGISAVFKTIVFGCEHSNSGSFAGREMGVFGLGGGPVSFISQAGPLSGGRKFSYCLTPLGSNRRSATSEIVLGTGSEVVGDGVVSTPLVPSLEKTPYLVTLHGISVGMTYVPFYSAGAPLAEGNMAVDLRTSPIYLPPEFHGRVVAEVRKQMGMQPLVGDRRLGPEPLLCYQTSKEEDVDGPIMTVHFDGADLTLMPIQIFIPQHSVPGVHCLGIRAHSYSNTSGVYGNFGHANFLMGYDLEKMTLSFKPTDCTLPYN